MDPVEAMLKEVIARYQQLPDTRAIALIGSRAREMAKPWSDVNLMVVSFRHPAAESRRNLVERISDYGKNIVCSDYPVPIDQFTKGGFPFVIWHVIQDVICDRVAGVEKLRRPDKTMILGWLHECRILWDPKRQLKAWKKRVSPIPELYKQAVIPQIFTEVTTAIKDLAHIEGRHNLFYMVHEIMASLENIYEIICLINGDYLNLSHSIDQIVNSYKKLPKQFKIQSRWILESPCDSEQIRKKWRFLAELAFDTGRFIEENGTYDLKTGWTQLKDAAPFLFRRKGSV